MAKAKTGKGGVKAAELDASEPEPKETPEVPGLPELTEEQVAVALDPKKLYVSVDLPAPIPVLVGPLNKSAHIVRLERQELAPGQRDGLKAPGETLYICVRDDDPKKAEVTFVAANINRVLPA